MARELSIADFEECDGIPDLHRERTVVDQCAELLEGFLASGRACITSDFESKQEADRIAYGIRRAADKAGKRVRVAQRGTRLYVERRDK